MGGLKEAWEQATRIQKAAVVIALLVVVGVVGSIGGATGPLPPSTAALAGDPTPSSSMTFAAVSSDAASTTRLQTAVPTIAPTESPVSTAEPGPESTPSALPEPTAVPGTVGVYGNPWGFDFGSGALIYRPPQAFCSYFDCITSFWISTNGYVVQCVDLTFSHSGGRTGVCSRHGGYLRTLVSH